METLPPQVLAQFHLANAWAQRGRSAQALEGYQAVVAVAPDYVPARLKLAETLVAVGRGAEALKEYARALALDPADQELRFRHHVLARELDRAAAPPQPPRAPYVPADHPDGMLNLSNQKFFSMHRSGWDYSLHALEPLHSAHGILFDGFIENNFAWLHWTDTVRPPDILERMKQEGTLAHYATSAERGITPYRVPWVGVFHNPPGIPHWFHYREAPQTILRKEIWQESAHTCRGLFALSDYLAEWLRAQTGLPVSTLRYTAEIPDTQFDFEKFNKNTDKKILQIGWWLRKLNAIYQLPLAQGNALGYGKIRLVPLFFPRADAYLRELMEIERAQLDRPIEPQFAANTREILNVTDSAYDALLAENIAFIELYDASANTVVVECIARATPLLVNPLPAVVEYLGAAYPFYFDTLEQAAAKALDLDLVRETHHYLKQCEMRGKLGGDYFLQSVRDSEVYRNL